MGYLEAIEERVKELYPDAFDEDNTLLVKEGRIVKLQRIAYSVGATEQKAIDIDKACEWLFMNIGHYVNEQGFVETHELEKDFRKAVEE